MRGASLVFAGEVAVGFAFFHERDVFHRRRRDSRKGVPSKKLLAPMCSHSPSRYRRRSMLPEAQRALAVFLADIRVLRDPGDEELRVAIGSSPSVAISSAFRYPYSVRVRTQDEPLLQPMPRIAGVERQRDPVRVMVAVLDGAGGAVGAALPDPGVDRQHVPLLISWASSNPADPSSVLNHRPGAVQPDEMHGRFVPQLNEVVPAGLLDPHQVLPAPELGREDLLNERAPGREGDVTVDLPEDRDHDPRVLEHRLERCPRTARGSCRRPSRRRTP
jgi:hypothetical protein